MKITKQVLKEQLSNTELEKFILRDILEDSKGYNGSFLKRIKLRLSDVNHGCITEVVEKLIYNSDCLKFLLMIYQNL